MSENQINTKTFSYQVERVIETLPLHDGYYIYLDTRKIGEKVLSTECGFATRSDIEQVDAFTNINKLKYPYYLCHKDILPILHNNSWGLAYSIIMHKDNKELYVLETNIFEYVKEHGPDNLILLQLNGHTDGCTYDIHGNKVLTSYYFDYMNGSMHDGCYDLNQVLEVIQNHPNVKLTSDGIQSIPYYNRDEYHKYTLDFVFTPTVEEFELIKNIKNRTSIGKYIIENFLKVQSKTDDI